MALSVTPSFVLADLNHSIKIGDNFISPSIKTPTTISTVLSGLTLGTDYSDVRRLNPSTKQWESYAAGQFTTFNPGCGYNIIGLRNASFSYGKTETITSFVYDSTGARVKKITPTSTSIYLGKDYDVSGSLTPGGAASLATKYIFLGDRRISSKDSSGQLLFFHEDHINSSNVITDASGNSAALYEYDPYGSTVTHTGSVDVKHRFTGQEADDTTRLYYYNGRYLDSQLGRFITADPSIQRPVDPQDFNRYAYARNNPIRYTDPTGFGWLSKLFALVAAVIFVVATAGQGLPAATIFWGAVIAGAAGGVAGAAIEKSSLLKGALDGAVIGAAVGAGAAYGGQGGGAASGGGGSGGNGVSILRPAGWQDSGTFEITGVSKALAESGLSEQVKIIVGNAIFGGVAWASESAPSAKKASPAQDKTLLIFSRNLGNPLGRALGGRHMFAMDQDGNGYELDNLGGANQVFKYSPEEMQNYLKKWNGQIYGYLTVKVNSKMFDETLRYLDITRSGWPYRVSKQNSNAFIRDLVRGSGGTMPDDRGLGCTPGNGGDVWTYC